MELRASKSDILNNAIRITKPPIIKGIYFLLFNKEIVYIGSSQDFMHRLKMHRDERKIVFNGYHVIKIDNIRGRKLVAVENQYIKLYKPRFNRTANPDYLNKKKVLWFTFLKKFNTYKQVSVLSGVPLSTTNYIISGKRTVKDETYRKVFDAVMNYNNFIDTPT